MIVPLLLFLVLAIGAFAGLLALARAVRGQVETQIRLDRCVARATADFLGTHRDLDRINAQIIATRTALAASYLVPAAVPPLRAALTAQVLVQDLKRAHWEVLRAGWILKQGCGKPGDLATPLPPLSLTRDPPDSLGEQPLRWKLGAPSSARIVLAGNRRVAAAEMKASHDIPFSFAIWSAKWAVVP